MDHGGTNEMNQSTKGDKRTCTLALHKFVMPPIFEPDTPGGLRASIDWRRFSSSATAEDMAENTTVKSTCEGSRKRKNEKSSQSRLYADGRKQSRGPGYCAL